MPDMNNLRTEIHDRENSDDAKEICKNLIAYNEEHCSREDWREVTITLRDDQGKLVGGLAGHSDWGWMFVKWLWIDEKCRGQNLGTRLMQLAEEEAKRRKCRHIWLDTFSFQARGFYEKLGFTIFGELDEYPPGFQRYFLKKTIA